MKSKGIGILCMLYSKSNARQVCEAALGKITERRGPVRKFILHIFPLWLSMNCRMTFMNMQRWGGRSEQSYREMFKKDFDWFGFNCELVKSSFKGEMIGIFDPSFIKKAGKKTDGRGLFYSGTAGRVLNGLEVGCLCFAGVEEHPALHGLAVQSPTPESLHQEQKTLVTHYQEVITERAAAIKALTSLIVVDGYFMKKDFIGPVLAAGLQVITKARWDANLQYVFKGRQKPRGRKRLCDGKIDTAKVDGRRLPLLGSDPQKDVFAGVVYSVLVKRLVLAVFIYYKDPKTAKYRKDRKTKKAKPAILISTDVELAPETVCEYYGLRFQVEFLLRDAKSYCGLEDCQARSKEKLRTHFNVALTAVSVARVAYYLSLPQEQRTDGFSIQDVKMMHMNALLTNRIFSNLNIDPSCKKYQHAYENSLNFGRLRA